MDLPIDAFRYIGQVTNPIGAIEGNFLRTFRANNTHRGYGTSEVAARCTKCINMTNMVVSGVPYDKGDGIESLW